MHIKKNLVCSDPGEGPRELLLLFLLSDRTSCRRSCSFSARFRSACSCLFKSFSWNTQAVKGMNRANEGMNRANEGMNRAVEGMNRQSKE